MYFENVGPVNFSTLAHWVERRVHNSEVPGSKPGRATFFFFFHLNVSLNVDYPKLGHVQDFAFLLLAHCFHFLHVLSCGLPALRLRRRQYLVLLSHFRPTNDGHELQNSGSR